MDEYTSQRRELPVDWHIDDSPELESQEILSISDALMNSLERFGKVNLPYIARAANCSPDDAISSLGSAIWQNPETWMEDPLQGWETSDQYLAGDLPPKLEMAELAAKKWPELFKRNILALKAVMPAPIGAENIYMDLGSPWIPPEIINLFINSLLKSYYLLDLVQYDPLCGLWSVARPTGYRYLFKNTRALRNTYGAAGCSALRLLEKTLNRSQIKGIVLKEKQRRLRNAFQRWLRENPGERKILSDIYSRKFGFIRKRVYDGSFLTFPGMSKNISLYSHQRNAVARIIFSGSTLLAHALGAGKTYTMIAAGMELKRLGRSAKNLFIVPNNILLQWEKAFHSLYPDAKIMVAGPAEFKPTVLPQTLEQIKNGDYDGIIMAFSCADRLDLSPQWRLRILDEEISNIRGQAASTQARGRITQAIAQKLKKLERDYTLLANEAELQPPGQLFFDQLGITAMFLDEAHNYKNVPIATTLTHVRGINALGSRKCANMLAKARYIQSIGGPVVLATGTPISNSITDVFNMQQFLQKGALCLFGLDTFDAWAANFAEPREVLELDIDANRFHTVERLAQFHNLPELSAIFSQVTDFAEAVSPQGLPECKEREDLSLPGSKALKKYMRGLSERADIVRRGDVAPDEDNLLKITTDGRKAALDMRLVDKDAIHSDNCKAALCAATVATLWREHQNDKSAQLIFCDLSTPKKGFNVYDKVRGILIEAGIPRKEIAFAHEHDAADAREELYKKIRKGSVRILIGSTFKLGLGVNIQERLVALHHLDAPWRPADMAQREGRILREGNTHKNVRIFRYVTEGSFDSWCWQILETKQRFIASFLAGNLYARDAFEQDSITLSYAEIKALAVGNPLIRARVECATQIEHTMLLRRAREEELENMRMEIVKGQQKQGELEKKLIPLKNDIALAKKFKKPGADLRAGLEAELAQALARECPPDKKTGEYRGFQLSLAEEAPAGTTVLSLSGSGRYLVEIGKDPILKTLDKTISSFAAKAKKIREDIAEIIQRRQDMEGELAEADPYVAKIKKLQAKLAKIDRQLEEE